MKVRESVQLQTVLAVYEQAVDRYQRLTTTEGRHMDQIGSDAQLRSPERKD